VWKFSSRMPATRLAHLFHRLPHRKHLGMLMRNLESAIFPCEDFDKPRGPVGVAPLQSNPGLLVDQFEFFERRPMTLEQADKLAPRLHAIGSYDDLRIRSRHHTA
jgi:hypothetical protein